MPTITTKTDLKTYWPYASQGQPFDVYYKYCVVIQGISPSDDAACSLPAHAKFTINGVSSNATIKTQPTNPVRVWKNSAGNWFMQAGNSAMIETSGIVFTQDGGNAPSGGSFYWAQIILSDNASGIGSSYYTHSCVGLDNLFPYASGNQTSDSPNVGLDPRLTEMARVFEAHMYLMWKSSSTGSIYVPIGSVAWTFAGDAVQNTSNGKWSKQAASNPTATGYSPAGPNSPNLGFPVWNNTCKNTQ
jgi:hypothetical protein